MRTVVLRVVALALLLLLALFSVLSIRTLRRLPDTIVYFVRTEPEGFKLAPAGRQNQGEDEEARLLAALQALTQGPSEAEQAAGLTSSLPKNTDILSLELSGTSLSVDLSGDFAEGGGSSSMVARLNQLLYTLTQPASVNEVYLSVEGRPLTVLGGEGIMVPQPWRRLGDDLPTW